MSRPYLYMLLQLLFLMLPQFGISQTIRDNNSRLVVKISNGEIRDSNSRKIGTIYIDGVIRNSNGEKMGTIREGKVVNENGLTIFKYDNGIIRDRDGRLVYKIATNGDIRDSSGRLILSHENIEFNTLVGYLSFFYSQV